MDEMLLTISMASFVAWVYLIGFRGSFWRSTQVLPVCVPTRAAKVAVVIPARNEAASIERSLESLLRQDYAGELSVVLVDDGSTDGTGTIAASLAKDARLKVVKGLQLEDGWSGKLWAVHQGLAQAAVKAADYVLLTDADVEHRPEHISTLVSKAEAEDLDLVSEMVRLRCETLAERALIPAFVFFFQMLYPFDWVASSTKRVAGAAGGTMLIRRATLDRVEGVTRIRARLIDDCALAKEIQSAGGRLWIGHSELAASQRVCANWRDVGNMIARTAYEQLDHSPWILLGCVVGMTFLYGVPPLLAFLANGLPRGIGLLTWGMMAGVYQPTLRRFRRSPLWGFALPGIGLFYLCATVISAIRFHAGRGGGWKDRVYPARPAA